MMRPAAEVCHPVQMTVWSDEIVEAISDHLAVCSYGDKVDLSLSIERELKRIIGDAFGMAETELL